MTLVAEFTPEGEITSASSVAFRTEGAPLSRDLIERIAGGDRDLPGARPEDYHLAAAERLGEAANRIWAYLRGAYWAFRDRLGALPPGDSGTSLTRERWLLVLLNELGFGRVPFVRGGVTSHQPPGFSTEPLTGM